MKLVAFEKINCHREKGMGYINLEENPIIAISEKHVEPTRLYNENGDLVSETPNEQEFVIITKLGQVFRVTKTELDKLLANE